MIHIRSGKVPVKPALFNEAFMMHTSTSPQYSIIASTDVSAKMMDDAGEYLTDECIVEAIDFRQAMARIRQEVPSANPATGGSACGSLMRSTANDFADVDPALCAATPCLAAKARRYLAWLRRPWR